ncbi:DUF6318 family protein [Phycicoccus sp. M110.8]|uniref:DUF6318 family protein n=1 Tax=Phycicoccus sp. M110.8 TaxID=3075433 RepID=UPI0028FD337C|nr:DUF6318 family protein [Phycicoccus sp. M110.8]MDU0314395.1 DUF6318 family protein [Phycicoccus sp. M110.8]
MDARRGYAVGFAVLALTVSACTANGEEPAKTSSTAPSSSSTSSSTTAPSSTPTSGTATVDPADLPPEARKRTPEGAAAFVRYFVEQSNKAWTEPDAGLLPPLSDSGCLSCQALQRTAAGLVAKKQRYRSAPLTLSKVAALPGGPAGQQYVRVIGTQNRVDVVDASGKVVSTDQKKPVALTASAVWRGKTWLVYDMG